MAGGEGGEALEDCEVAESSTGSLDLAAAAAGNGFCCGWFAGGAWRDGDALPADEAL